MGFIYLVLLPVVTNAIIKDYFSKMDFDYDRSSTLEVVATIAY